MVVLACNGMTQCKLGCIPRTITIDIHGNIIKSKYVASSSSGKFQVKANSTVKKFNDHWSMLFPAAITAMSLKPEMMLPFKNKGPNMVSDVGTVEAMLQQDGLYIFRQKFLLRSYEIGPNRKASIETLMNYSQETIHGHLKEIGLVNDGINYKVETSKKNLLAWVFTKMQMVVDRYPSWGDIVQVDTWISMFGKNRLCCNWTFSGCETDEIIARGSSILVMMNIETRKLSRFPNEVRAITEQRLSVDALPMVVEDSGKGLIEDEQNIADRSSKRLTPRWSDLDANQHVNNAKYIGMVLESVPKPILKNYELASMTLDYYQECTRDSILQSHTCTLAKNENNSDDVDCQHVLRLENSGGGGDGAEILRGRTRWRP